MEPEPGPDEQLNDPTPRTRESEPRERTQPTDGLQVVEVAIAHG